MLFFSTTEDCSGSGTRVRCHCRGMIVPLPSLMPTRSSIRMPLSTIPPGRFGSRMYVPLNLAGFWIQVPASAARCCIIIVTMSCQEWRNDARLLGQAKVTHHHGHLSVMRHHMHQYVEQCHDQHSSRGITTDSDSTSYQCGWWPS